MSDSSIQYLPSYNYSGINPFVPEGLHRRRSLAEVKCSNYVGMKQLIAGGGIALIGVLLVPLLSNLLG